jgi:hypothetical protein
MKLKACSWPQGGRVGVGIASRKPPRSRYWLRRESLKTTFGNPTLDCAGLTPVSMIGA